MNTSIQSSPHLPAANSVSIVMLKVMAALLPGSVCMTWVFGWGVLLNIAIAALTCIVSEAVLLRLRGKLVGMTLLDGSALVTGVLLALALPPFAPWWIPVIGCLFAIVIAKQLYGGLGYNPFNPAMVGYAVLLISFPLEMTLWPHPEVQLGLLDSLAITFTGNFPGNLDALTMATPLDTIKTRLGLGETLDTIRTGPLFGFLAGTGWEWVNFWFLVGGVWLLQMKVIDWRIPLGMLGGLFLMALVFYFAGEDTHVPPLLHLFSGAAMLCAFFIATDPVSASTTPRGRIIFGLGVGVLTYIIRTWGGYPDGVAFAVLLMNMAAPVIDHYTQPRVFGHK
jgi:electron transport complex protein RnfD